MKLARLLAVAAVSVAALSFGHAGAGAVASAAAAPALKADNFRLTSADLQSYELYPMVDAKAVVIVTQANGDAAVRQAAPALKALKAAYAAKGVEFMMIDSKLNETRAQVAADRAASGLGIPILFDYDQLIGEGYSEFKAIRSRHADGYYGWEEAGPFDKIIVTCGIDHIPPPLLKQLKVGGIMVIPVGPPGAQRVLKVVKEEGSDGVVRATRSDIYGGRIVPFVPFTKLEGGTIKGTHNQ